MTTRKISTIVTIASILILGGYDVWAYLQKDDGTISVVMWMWTQANPITPFLFGFLMGHWFAPPVDMRGSK